MPEGVGTETTRTDGPGADESLSGGVADESPATVAGEQDSKEETSQEQQGSGDAGEQDTAGENTEAQSDDGNGDDAAPPEDLKVVVSIKGGRTTVGVQQPSSDPHIESFVDRDLTGLTGELPAVIERARTGWQESPKHPAYQRPDPPAGRRNRRGQGAAQASTGGAETEQAQQQMLKLF